MKKLLFIINPKAGVKKNKHFVDDALEIFEKAGYKVGVKYTKKRADGTRIARDYGANCVYGWRRNTQRGNAGNAGR